MGKSNSSSEPVLKCSDLNCGYGGHAVVSDISLSAAPGEILSLIGGSGSGKSTLLRTLAGLQPPVSGCVELLGENLGEIDRHEQVRVKRRSGMLFQEGALFGSMTVLDNVMLPLREVTDLPVEVAEEMARSRLDLVELARFADRMPDEISGGQAKRAALARAVVLDPAIVFCDEPTSGLDPIAGAQVDRTLLELRDTMGTAIVAVTHDMDSVRTISDSVLMLDDGRAVVGGSLDEVLESGEELVRRFIERDVGDDRDKKGGSS